MKNLLLILLFLLTFQAFSQKVNKPTLVFYTYRCLSPQPDENESRITNRIIDSTLVNNSFEIKLEVTRTCGYGEVGKIKIANDTLFLFSERACNFDIGEKGDTLFYENEVFCECDYILDYEIADIKTLPKVIMYENKLINVSNSRYLRSESQKIGGKEYPKYDKFGNEFIYHFNENGLLKMIEKIKGKTRIQYYYNEAGEIVKIENRSYKGE